MPGCRNWPWLATQPCPKCLQLSAELRLGIGARPGLRVAPTFVLKYNIRTRSLADSGVIEDVPAVENDVVPFDRADVPQRPRGTI